MNAITLSAGVADVPLARVEGIMPYQAHEANIEHEAFDNSTLRGASDALKFFRETVNADNDFRGNMDPENRAARHDRLVAERVEGSQRAVESRLGTAMGNLRAEWQRVERELADKAGLKADPKWMNAVVGTMHDLPNDGARAQAVAEMIERGDNASLAALIEAPAFVTKLPPELRDGIKGRVLEKADPVAFRLRNALLKAMEKIEAAGNVSAPTFAQLRAGTEPGAAKARAEMAAARSMASNASR